jgi:hypothetical protein
MRLRRSYDLTRDLTILFVCAVSTVLLTRSFLALAGYPQVGGSKFHIAHVLYGGLLLTVSCICLLAFLSPAVKPVAAVLAGIGFGLFIDEVGKFITKNVNYFYRPAFAIIYICFVVMFGVIRWLGRRRFTSDEALLIGIDALEREAVGSLSDERRAVVLALMKSTECSGRSPTTSSACSSTRRWPSVTPAWESGSRFARARSGESSRSTRASASSSSRC